jgi:hypothetical protein
MEHVSELYVRRISPKFALYLVADEQKQRKFGATKNMAVALTLSLISFDPPVISSCFRE